MPQFLFDAERDYKHLKCNTKCTYPIVVIKLVVKEPSENRKRRQLFPTPSHREKALIRTLTQQKT
jgi:hypothetical protein